MHVKTTFESVQNNETATSTTISHSSQFSLNASDNHPGCFKHTSDFISISLKTHHSSSPFQPSPPAHIAIARQCHFNNDYTNLHMPHHCNLLPAPPDKHLVLPKDAFGSGLHPSPVPPQMEPVTHVHKCSLTVPSRSSTSDHHLGIQHAIYILPVCSGGRQGPLQFSPTYREVVMAIPNQQAHGEGDVTPEHVRANRTPHSEQRRQRMTLTAGNHSYKRREIHSDPRRTPPLPRCLNSKAG